MQERDAHAAAQLPAQRQDAPAQICRLCRQHSAALLLCPCQAERGCLQRRTAPPATPPRRRVLQDGGQRLSKVGAGRRNGVPLLLAERQAGHQVGKEGGITLVRL